MSELKPTSAFKKMYKKVKKNPRWQPIFNGQVPFEHDERSPWDYVVDHFLQDLPLPDYFYEHPITLSNQQKKELKKRLGNIDNLKITGLDLHFDGHNGDHLLLYAKTNQQIIYLVGIGSHSDLF